MRTAGKEGARVQEAEETEWGMEKEKGKEGRGRKVRVGDQKNENKYSGKAQALS